MKKLKWWLPVVAIITAVLCAFKIAGHAIGLSKLLNLDAKYENVKKSENGSSRIIGLRLLTRISFGFGTPLRQPEITKIDKKTVTFNTTQEKDI